MLLRCARVDAGLCLPMTQAPASRSSSTPSAAAARTGPAPRRGTLVARYETRKANRHVGNADTGSAIVRVLPDRAGRTNATTVGSSSAGVGRGDRTATVCRTPSIAIRSTPAGNETGVRDARRRAASRHSSRTRRDKTPQHGAGSPWRLRAPKHRGKATIATAGPGGVEAFPSHREKRRATLHLLLRLPASLLGAVSSSGPPRGRRRPRLHVKFRRSILGRGAEVAKVRLKMRPLRARRGCQVASFSSPGHGAHQAGCRRQEADRGALRRGAAGVSEGQRAERSISRASRARAPAGPALGIQGSGLPLAFTAECGSARRQR